MRAGYVAAVAAAVVAPSAAVAATFAAEPAPAVRLRPAVVLVDEKGAVRGWTFCVSGRAVYVTVRAVAQGAIGSCPEGPWAP